MIKYYQINITKPKLAKQSKNSNDCSFNYKKIKWREI